MRQYASLAHDDEDKYDMSKDMPDSYEPPDYPTGCQFSLREEDLEKADVGGVPHSTMRFSAMGEVTSVYNAAESCRVEIELKEFAGDDGKFFDLSVPTGICLCQSELDKMGLEADCEKGDMIHLIGTARLESTLDSNIMGKMATLQITEMTFEDESEESREG